MKEKKLIAPSILSADFSKLGEEVRAVEQAGADLIHIDVMDGHFVPNITVGPAIVSALKKVTSLPLDVHLMIENPQNFIPQFAAAGATHISVHVEQGYHLDRTISLIKEHKALAGIALNPATPIESVFPMVSGVDTILVMTVNPGFGGQKFIPHCKDKIKRLKAEINKMKAATAIEVDGGITVDNVAELSSLGVTIFVAGTAIFATRDYAKTIAQMKNSL